jgi:hypothetical protein
MDVLENLEEAGLTLNDYEKQFFVNQNSEIMSYVNSKGEKAVKFIDDKFRLKCIENFLAFHSFEIGNPTNEIPDGAVLYLQFNGDQDVAYSMANPIQSKDRMSWKVASDFDEGSDMRNMVDEMKNKEPTFTNVIIRINRFNDDDIMYLFPFKFRSFELYTEVILPWVLENKYKQPMVVYLSCFQYDVFFPKNGDGVKVDFYPTDNGYEPIIVDEEKKCSIIANIASRIDEKESVGDAGVIVFHFKSGDRDILSAWAGNIRYKCYEISTIDYFKDEPIYDKLKESAKPIVVYSYLPGTDQQLYCGIVSRK